jgi:hypothetical protein
MHLTGYTMTEKALIEIYDYYKMPAEIAKFLLELAEEVSKEHQHNHVRAVMLREAAKIVTSKWLSALDNSKKLSGVDGQVMLAARSLDATQQGQPEWLWHDICVGTTTYGRWQKTEAQAPYIRADLVASIIPNDDDEL